MARPTTNTVDYFSHDCQHKQTIFILESRYGNNGYAFWFKLLEMLGATPDHFIDCNNDVSCEFLAAKTNSTWCFCSEVLDLLAKLQAICPDLWTQKIVWSQKFVDRLAGVYKKRGKESPVKPSFCNRNDTTPVVPVTETPQSKVKDSIGNKRKGKTADAVKIPASLNTEDFCRTWKQYLEYCNQKKKATTPIGLEQLLSKLEFIGVSRAIERLSSTMSNNYIGVFFKGETRENGYGYADLAGGAGDYEDGYSFGTHPDEDAIIMKIEQEVSGK